MDQQWTGVGLEMDQKWTGAADVRDGVAHIATCLFSQEAIHHVACNPSTNVTQLYNSSRLSAIQAAK